MSKSAVETLNDSSQLEPYSRCAIQDLPSEILEHIFCFLNIEERIRTELVCRRWRDIGTNVLWTYPTKLDFRTVRKMKLERIFVTNDVVLAILSRCGRSVRHMSVFAKSTRYPSLELDEGFKGTFLTNKVVDIIGDNCPNLTEAWLMVPNEHGTADYLINLAQRCPKLKKLFLRSIPDLNDDILSSFFKYCHSLDYLNLRSRRQSTGNFIDSLKTDLKGIHISGNDLSMKDISEKLVKRCPHIEELALSSLPHHNSLAMLKMVLRYYRNSLKKLCLAGYSMEPSEWYCIPDMIPHLQVLSLNRAKGVDDQLMEILAAKCMKLRSLDLSETEITDAGVVALASAPSLTELNLEYTKVTGDGLESFANQGRLEKLIFSMSGPDTSKLEESCISLAKSCRNLRFLNLSGENITDRLVEEINSSLVSGFLKGPVRLYVSETKVTGNVKCCHKLRLFFSCPENGAFTSEVWFME